MTRRILNRIAAAALVALFSTGTSAAVLARPRPRRDDCLPEGC